MLGEEEKMLDQLTYETSYDLEGTFANLPCHISAHIFKHNIQLCLSILFLAISHECFGSVVLSVYLGWPDF